MIQSFRLLHKIELSSSRNIATKRINSSSKYMIMSFSEKPVTTASLKATVKRIEDKHYFYEKKQIEARVRFSLQQVIPSHRAPIILRWFSRHLDVGFPVLLGSSWGSAFVVVRMCLVRSAQGCLYSAACLSLVRSSFAVLATPVRPPIAPHVLPLCLCVGRHWESGTY